MIGEIIRNARKNENLTAKDLSLKLNVSASLIYEWEHDRSKPAIEELIKLADCFDLSIDYLVGRTDELGVIKRENNALTASENELLFNFRKLDAVKQSKVIGYCYAMAN
ncbi:MAG: helix-turn-helix transcriptional regulator [Clostridia bacterium]|nr:helix-turn-helix transcriptional regulator [Clostridia bacterium]